MEEQTRAFDVRPLLLALAVLVGAAAIWAATAFGAGGSSTSSPPAGDAPTASYVQSGNDGESTAPGDCPDRGDGSGGDSGSSDATPTAAF
jgi:hypothetical protein